LGLPELLIDRIDPRQEALHRREQLILQPGDLLLPIGGDRSSSASGAPADGCSEARAASAGTTPPGQPDYAQKRGNLKT
jgi:hypothetical protein